MFGGPENLEPRLSLFDYQKAFLNYFVCKKNKKPYLCHFFVKIENIIVKK